MKSNLIARPPRQERSRQRVSQILEGAEQLLLTEGISGFSIPALAEQLQFPRATLYKFFPTPHALLNSLAERHLEALEALLFERAQVSQLSDDWRVVSRQMIEAAAGYYRENPVACILLLGGPVSDESYRSLEYTINRLGRLTHNMLQRAGLTLLESPCEAAMAIEFGTASFRFSYFLHQSITPEYIEAAGDVMIAFIEKRLKIRI